ncbi:MAG: RagB/SusD family nutrient uptake outer membrane protein [Chitinophagaceae bacterium]|nr:RagB/SusD family nutrient uptake outer membrane protein [Chitinophagaceae bacterium]
MNIKHIFPSALIASLLLPSTSCNKKFLELDPQGQLTKGQVLVDPNAANNLVTGVYNTLYLGAFDPTTVGFQYYMATDVASDDADKGSTPTDFAPAADIDNFTVTPNNSILNNLWIGYYKGIARANVALEQLTNASFDETTRRRLVGETRFIRGMYYFNLVRLFGGVPKLIRVPTASEFNSDEFQTRVSKDEIYTIITDDLQYGVDSLPEKGDGATQVGRATKGAAESFLAKVYMYKGDWQKVFDLTNDVINSGKYSLVVNKGDTLTDYNLIFREKAEGGAGGNNNSESIFEVQTGLNQTEDGVSKLYSNAQGPRGKGGWDDLGFGFNNPTQDLVNAYEPGDTRKAGTIIFINPTVAGNSPGTVLWDGFRIPSQDSVTNQRYNYKGYVSALKESAQASNNKDTKPKNIRLMRYAEVLLMHAEAAATVGGDALTPLNMVRSRAGLPAAPSAAQADIWKERRVELAMEQDRFFDLVRQGRAGQVLRAHGKGFVDGKNEIFPIPQAQIDLSGNRLAQNPNY